MTDLTPNTRLKRSEGMLHGDLGETSVMMDLEAGNYFGLNDVATRIWELLEEPRTLAELVGLLLAEYEVERARCEDKVRTFAADMLEKRLLVCVSETKEHA